MALSTGQLPYFQAGVPLAAQLTAVNLNSIIRRINEITPLTGTGMYMKRVPGGMVLDVRRTFTGGSAPFPWQLIDLTNNDAGHQLRVRPGSINGLVPSNIFDIFPFDDSVTQWITLTVTSNGEAATSCLLSIETVEPGGIGSAAGSAPTEFTDVIGMIDGGTLYQVRAENLTAEVRETIRVDKSSPTPGTLTYVPHYTWRILPPLE